MRITITQEFDSVEAAAVFLARVGNPAHVVERLTADPVPEAVAERTAVLVDALKTRKPRADAGKKREPYGPRTTTTGEPAASEPGAQASIPATTTSPAAPATPTINDRAPVGVGNSEADPGRPAAGSADKAVKGSTPPAVSLTLDDARAALKKLNDAPGKGTEACLAALRAFKVVRISDVKSEDYPDFIKHVLAEAAKK